MSFPLINLTPMDTQSPGLLYRVLKAVVDTIAAIGAAVDDIKVQLSKKISITSIRDSLQATGTAPLNVTSLRGVLSDPQPASILRYDSGVVPTGLELQALRDTQFFTVKNGSAYDLYMVIGGNPNTSFKLIAGASGGTFMTLDTTQTVLNTGIKTINAAWTWTVNQLLQASSNAALTWTIVNTSTGTSANAQFAAQNDGTVLVSIRSHASTRVVTRYGVTLANVAELLASGGSAALLVGSTDNVPIVFGSNNTEVARFKTSGCSITGTNTNDSAATGYVGEFIQTVTASGSAVSLSTGTAADVASIALTPGDWDVSGMIGFLFDTTTSYTILLGSFSTTSATVGPEANIIELTAPATVPGIASAKIQFAMPTVRVSINANTTVYLVAQAVFTVSTLKAYGWLSARRVR